MKIMIKTLPKSSENNFEHVASNSRTFDCPEENIIYTFRSNPYKWGSTDCMQEYWKINLNLLNDSGILGFFLEEHLFKNSKIPKLNDDNFVFLRFDYYCRNDHTLKNYLFLSLLKFKLKFKFDNVSLQSIYDSMTADEKELFEEDAEEFSDDEISKLNTAGMDDEFYDYLDECIDEDENIYFAFDDCNNWNEIYQLVDRISSKISTKWKKIRANCKRRETNYRNQGLEILSGKEAFEAISKSRTHSLLGCDTVNWCALEYNDYDNLYTFREIVDNHMYYTLKSFRDYFDMEFILSKKWALRKYHTGIIGLELPEPKKISSK